MRVIDGDTMKSPPVNVTNQCLLQKTVTRLKDSLTKTEEDLESKRSAEASLQNELRRLQRQLREANNLANDVDTRESK